MLSNFLILWRLNSSFSSFFLLLLSLLLLLTFLSSYIRVDGSSNVGENLNDLRKTTWPPIFHKLSSSHTTLIQHWKFFKIYSVHKSVIKVRSTLICKHYWNVDFRHWFNVDNCLTHFLLKKWVDIKTLIKQLFNKNLLKFECRQTFVSSMHCFGPNRWVQGISILCFFILGNQMKTPCFNIVLRAEDLLNQLCISSIE